MARRKKKTPVSGNALKETKRQRVLRRLKEMQAVRASWEKAWKTIVEQIFPYRARWDQSAFNNGNPLTTNIINNTPYDALRVLAAGMMSGVTSPAKPWFRLTLEDLELTHKKAVKVWLEKVEKVVANVLEKRGFYGAVSDGGYRDLGTIGTAVILEEVSEEDQLPTFESVPIGEYYLDVNDKSEVDTYMRVRTFTVKQLVERFGYDKCSQLVRDNWDNDQLSKLVETVHTIWPNEDYVAKAPGVAGKPFVGYWCETKGDEDELILEEHGYYEFPVLAPRWGARSGEPYGRGPGWYAVGDCLALQHLMKKLARLVDKSADPPMVAVDTMKTKRASLIPGDTTYVPEGQANAFTPAQVVHPQSISVLREYIQDHEWRIRDAFYYKLWMSLLNDQRAQRPTATEVEATKQEVMLQLGPVLETLNWELLDPLISRTIAILDRAGLLPKPPEELQGMEIRVQFISVMHMAQHMVGISAVRELENHVVGLVGMGLEEAAMKVDVGKLLEEVGEMAGVPRAILRTEEEVEAIRAERAAAAAAQQNGEAMLAATQGAKNLAGAGIDPQNIGELLNQTGPVVEAQGTA